MTTSDKDGGFTLIEALVAMAILAVAAGGLIRASEGHIDTVARLEARAAADLVASNRVAEPDLPASAAPATVTMLGHQWQVRAATAASADPDLAAATITVDGAGSRTTLRTFRDKGVQP